MNKISTVRVYFLRRQNSMIFTLKIREIFPLKHTHTHRHPTFPSLIGNQRFENILISSTYKGVRTLAVSSTTG